MSAMDKKTLCIFGTVSFGLLILIVASCTTNPNATQPANKGTIVPETIERSEPSPIIPAATLMQDISPQDDASSTAVSSTTQTAGGGTIVLATVERPDPPTTPVATLTRDMRLQTNLAPTPLPTLIIEETAAMICQEPPRLFNLLDKLGIQWINNLRFKSEELLTFEGWTERPEPSVLPRTPEPTPESFPIPNSSSRILLTGGQLDLLSGEMSARSLDVDAPLANPCGESCPLEVLGQSPSGEWQLVQVNDWLRSRMGLWLVSAETAIRIVPYVPAYPEWQWAEDSSLLWLVYNYDEVGGETMIIRLGNPPTIHVANPGGLLDPVVYWGSLYPVDNTALAVPAPGIGHEDMEKIFKIALDSDLERATGVWSIPGIKSVAWNEATQSIIAQVISESGVAFQELPGGFSLTIPNEALSSFFPTFTSAESDLPTGFSAAGDWAVSPSGGKLALLRGPSTLWVFDCVPAP